jgi:hypothetical protein
MWLCTDHMDLLIADWVFRIWRRSGVQLLRSAKASHLTKLTRISITLKKYGVEPMAYNGVYLVLCIGLV